MKKLVVLVLMGAITFSIGPVQAQQGASESGREHASDKAIFNRVGDWFATVGKSDVEKVKIKAQRKAKREARKMEKKAQKAKKQAEKAGKKAMEEGGEAERMKEKIKKQHKNMKKGSKKN